MFNQFGNQQPYNFNAPAMPYMPQFQPTQAQNQQTVNVSWVYVNGLEGARNQIVQPNQTAWMMDNNDPVIYVKSVDGMGTATLKAFRLEEISTDNKSQFEKTDNLSDYIRKDEINGILSRITALEETIGGLNK